jgi:hypothetical protein
MLFKTTTHRVDSSFHHYWKKKLTLLRITRSDRTDTAKITMTPTDRVVTVFLKPCMNMESNYHLAKSRTTLPSN